MKRRLAAAGAVVALLAWWLRPVPADPQTSEKPTSPASSAPATEAVAPAMRFDGPPPTDVVECELVAPLTNPFAIGVVEYTPGTLEPLPLIEVRQLDGWIRFRPQHADGLGRLVADGYAPATLAWIEGACLEPVELERLPGGRVEITVEGEVDETVAFVTTCSPYRPETMESGRFAFTTPQREPCEVHIGRRVGARFFTGSVHPVDPSLPDVHLSVAPPSPIPAPGWSLYRSDAGLKVDALEPNGAAAAAGVQLWDVILAFGAPGDELFELAPDADELVLEGTFDVEILRDDEVLTLTIGG